LPELLDRFVHACLHPLSGADEVSGGVIAASHW
jgi:hypothetical protein